ncbi:hypothetical protein M885DRAFT_439158, partial [Pelagophyceae sp. CCMP2097]
GLRPFGIELSEKESAALVNKFDRNASGSLSLPELIADLRGGDTTEKRMRMILKQFDGLLKLSPNPFADKISNVFLKTRFNPYHYPKLLKGEAGLTPMIVQNMFFALLDASQDGNVSRSEFVHFYENFSVSQCLPCVCASSRGKIALHRFPRP